MKSPHPPDTRLARTWKPYSVFSERPDTTWGFQEVNADSDVEDSDVEDSVGEEGIDDDGVNEVSSEADTIDEEFMLK